MLDTVVNFNRVNNEPSVSAALQEISGEDKVGTRYITKYFNKTFNQ